MNNLFLTQQEAERQINEYMHHMQWLDQVAILLSSIFEKEITREQIIEAFE